MSSVHGSSVLTVKNKVLKRERKGDEKKNSSNTGLILWSLGHLNSLWNNSSWCPKKLNSAEGNSVK